MSFRSRIAALAVVATAGFSASPASAFVQNIPGARISWSVTYRVCQPSDINQDDKIGDQAYEGKVGRIDFLRTIHVLELDDGINWVAESSRSYFKRFPHNNVHYYSPGYSRFGPEFLSWSPVNQFGVGLYRIKTYFRWYLNGNLRAQHILYTYCDLS